jgi:hypothetical protein
LNPSEFKDETDSYTFTEGCIDYNAGLVAALGYVLALSAPVDTGKFTGRGTALAPPRGRTDLRTAAGALGIDALGRLRPAPSDRFWFVP